MVKREDLIFKTDKYKYNFQSFETIRSFNIFLMVKLLYIMLMKI